MRHLQGKREKIGIGLGKSAGKITYKLSKFPQKLIFML